MQKLFSGNDINLFSPDILHEYLYVKDLAKIVSKLLTVKNSWNNVYHASGPKRSLHKLVKLIQDYAEANTDKPGSVNNIKKDTVMSFFLDSSKLESKIGKDIYSPDKKIVEQMGEFLKQSIIKGENGNR